MERSTAYDKRNRRIRRDPQFGYQSMVEHPANPPTYEVRRTARPPTTRTANSRTFLRILKMSYEGEDVKAFTVPLLKINAEDAGYDGLERSLGHIPNLWSHDVRSFKWKDRSLIEISAKELGHQWKEDFYMYKCTDPRARLKINAHFDDPASVRIYGDAFVFMAEPDTFDMEYDSSYTEVDGSEVLRFIPRAAYVNVDGAFAKSVWDHTECWKVVDKLALKEA